MERLATEIFNTLLDMDFMDYEETNETDLGNLKEDLELLQESGNGILLNVIQMLVEN